jgi:hypothetical protein
LNSAAILILRIIQSIRLLCNKTIKKLYQV